MGILNLDENKDAKRLAKLMDEAEASYYSEELKPAERLLNEALPLAESLTGGGTYPVAAILNMLAGVYHQTEREEMALEFAIKSFDIMDTCKEASAFDSAGIAGNVGEMLFGLERHDEAVEWLERTLKIKQKVIDSGAAPEADGEDLIASTLTDLAEAHQLAGDQEKAISYFLKAAQTAVKSKNVLGMSMTVLRSAEELGQADLNDEAAAVARKAVKLFEAALKEPEDDDAFGDPDTMLLEMAKEDFQEHGKEPAILIELRINDAMRRRRAGETVDVLGTLPEVSDPFLEMFGADSLEFAEGVEAIAAWLHLLANDSKDAAEFSEAEKHYRQALEIYRIQFDEDDEGIQALLETIRDLYKDTGRDPAEVV